MTSVKRPTPGEVAAALDRDDTMTPSPQALAAAARMLGYDYLIHDRATGRWSGIKHDVCTSYAEEIGSDADLYDRLLDTMPEFTIYKLEGQFYMYRAPVRCITPSGNGPTKLAAVLACVAAMEVK